MIIFLSLNSCSYLSAGEKEMANTTSVSGTVIIPAEVPSFVDSQLEIHLYKYDPFLADVSAQLIDQFSVQNYSHIREHATKTTFELGTEDIFEPNMNYYITVFILANDIRTHIGEKDGKQGLFTVLSPESPRTYTAIIRPVNTAK